MANARGQEIDKTHLSIDLAEQRGFIHRDYIAHCLRWTHVVKFLMQKGRYKQARILDIGCGKEVPLAKTLYSSRMCVDKYAGIDVNRLDIPPMLAGKKFPLELFSGDVCDLAPGDIGFDPNIITCFEVLEHVEPNHSIRILAKMQELLDTNTEWATIFISTPAWDPGVGAAANHVNEVKYEVLGSVLERMGFEIEGHWGTFASQKDYAGEISKYGPGAEKMFNELKEYYDSNYLATLLAPLFPSRSRNVLWQLKYRPNKKRVYPRLFTELSDYGCEPWSSSEKWRDWGKHV